MKQGLKSVLVVLLLFVGFTLGVGVGFFGITQGAGVVGAYAEEREAKAAAEKQAKEEEAQKAAEEEKAATAYAEEEKRQKEEASMTEEEKKAKAESLTGKEDPNAKVVYMTFDDGPSSKTPLVLDILKRYDVKATFFVTGYYPELRGYIREAYDDGHTIGLHTFSHNYGAVYASTDAYFQDLDAVGQVVKEQIGYVPSIIRFPGGASNTVSAKYCPGIMSSLVNMVHERGYEYYDWNASSADGGVVTADQAYQAAISQAQAGTKDIILLFHDSETKQTTVDALPAIIEYYKSQGYEFRPIKRGGFVYQHGVAN